MRSEPGQIVVAERAGLIEETSKPAQVAPVSNHGSIESRGNGAGAMAERTRRPLEKRVGFCVNLTQNFVNWDTAKEDKLSPASGWRAGERKGGGVTPSSCLARCRGRSLVWFTHVCESNHSSKSFTHRS